MGARSFRFFLALGLEILLLAALNWFDDWTIESLPIKFVGVATLSGFAYFIAVAEFGSISGSKKIAVIFWGGAIVMRLVVLPLTPSDDVWRYQWEGKTQEAGFNPYLYSPGAPELEPLRNSFPDWGRLNRRDFQNLYPPGAEVIFSGLNRVSNHPLFYKAVFALADLGVIALLLSLLGGESRFVHGAWYAWNPLIIYSFAGAAHFDSLMLLALMAGVLCLVKSGTAAKGKGKWWWALAAATALGLAISIKLVPVLLLLGFGFALGRRSVVLLVSLGIPVLLSLLYGFPQVPVWESLGRLNHVTRLNDLFWWVIEDTFWSNPHQKNYRYDLIIVVVATVISLLFYRNWKRGMLWTMGATLILSPVLHPWYCSWVLPFATWRRAYAWHMLSVSLFTYYLFWSPRLFELPWRTEPWMRGLIIVPPVLALILPRFRKQG